MAWPDKRRYKAGILHSCAITSVLVLVACSNKSSDSSDSNSPVTMLPAPAPTPAPTPTPTPAPVPEPVSYQITLKLLVPAYFYPTTGTQWDRLANAARSGAEIVAIFNPQSGSGTARDPNYYSAITNLRNAGGKVLGYVPSGYEGERVSPDSSCRPSAGSTTYSADDVVNCAQLYADFYGEIDGIFVDEMGILSDSASPAGSDLTFYTEVYDGLKAINAAWLIFGNPGTNAPEYYLRNGISGGADVLINFEGNASSYASAGIPDYIGIYSSQRFGSIIHDFLQPGSSATHNQIFGISAQRNADYIYITDDSDMSVDESGFRNPYNSLPSDWELLVEDVMSYNQH